MIYLSNISQRSFTSNNTYSKLYTHLHVVTLDQNVFTQHIPIYIQDIIMRLLSLGQHLLQVMKQLLSVPQKCGMSYADKIYSYRCCGVLVKCNHRIPFVTDTTFKKIPGRVGSCLSSLFTFHQQNPLQHKEKQVALNESILLYNGAGSQRDQFFTNESLYTLKFFTDHCISNFIADSRSLFVDLHLYLNIQDTLI